MVLVAELMLLIANDKMLNKNLAIIQTLTSVLQGSYTSSNIILTSLLLLDVISKLLLLYISYLGNYIHNCIINLNGFINYV